METKRLLAPAIIAGSMVAGALALPGVVNAQTAPPAPTEAPSVEAPTNDPAFVGEVDGDFDFEELSEEELAELEAEYAEWVGSLSDEEKAEFNAETQKFIDELKAAGVPVEAVNEDGLLDFDLPADMTDAQWEALASVCETHDGDLEAEDAEA